MIIKFNLVSIDVVAVLSQFCAYFFLPLQEQLALDCSDSPNKATSFSLQAERSEFHIFISDLLMGLQDRSTQTRGSH